jgi:enoyl-CoA hydratase/carnithine racemase
MTDLHVDASAPVALLTISRPLQRNAMSVWVVEGLLAALSRLAADPQIRAIVLAGAGAGFCAGSDLAALAGMTDAERTGFEAQSGSLARLIPALPCPVIAAAHGFAIGGGLTLAAACDIVITDRAARWSLPEVPIGLFPAWGLEAVAARTGRPAARRLAWGVDMLTGEGAFGIGLADDLADSHADVTERARAIAHRIAALPQQQARAVKHYFATTDMDVEVMDVRANRLFMQATHTAEGDASFQRFSRPKPPSADRSLD